MTIDLAIGGLVWLLGLCVGSFLNVVVYRLAIGLSIGKPSRSFCPRCEQPIAWYDNIPLLSWLLLGARCRRCRAPISLQYPLVEGLTGLTFVLIYYLLFVAHTRAGLIDAAHPTDWPLLGAWLVLAAALIACAAMDVTSYMVDVRITYTAIVGGTILHAGWPRHDLLATGGGTPLAAATVVAFACSIIMLWLTVWRVPEPDADPEPQAGVQEPSADATPGVPLAAVGRVATVILAGLALWLLAETALHSAPTRDVGRLRLPTTVDAWDLTGGASRHGLAPDWVVPAAVAVIFATTVLVGGQRREADAEVSAAIEQERPHARRLVLTELRWLALPIIAGAATYLALNYWPAAGTPWKTAAAWSPGAGFCPIGGAAVAIFGAIVGAALGWFLRIVFTLAFGREALGVGDIYILAAAGAAAGWDIAVLGLLLAVGLAIAGYVLSLILKRHAIIAFGPWLAIGFIAALWLNRPAAGIARRYHDDILTTWSLRPDLCFLAGGLMLVVSALAVVLARLARRLVEGGDKKPVH